jgi:hypothetical protein
MYDGYERQFAGSRGYGNGADRRRRKVGKLSERRMYMQNEQSAVARSLAAAFLQPRRSLSCDSVKQDGKHPGKAGLGQPPVH